MRAAWLWVLLLAAPVHGGAQSAGFRASSWGAIWQRDAHPSEFVEIDVDENDITATVVASGDTISRPVGSILFAGTLLCIGGRFADPFCPTADIQYRLMWNSADVDRCPAIRDGRTVRGTARFGGSNRIVIRIPRYVLKVSTCQVVHRGETETSLHLAE